MKRSMGREPARGRSGQSEDDRRPLAELRRAIVDLQGSVDALRQDADNEELHTACATKLAHVAQLAGEPELAPEIRKEARHQVLEATRWLASMPVAQRRPLPRPPE
jgi:hypothetical protein